MAGLSEGRRRVRCSRLNACAKNAISVSFAAAPLTWDRRFGGAWDGVVDESVAAANRSTWNSRFGGARDDSAEETGMLTMFMGEICHRSCCSLSLVGLTSSEISARCSEPPRESKAISRGCRVASIRVGWISVFVDQTG